jgi:hypothetical protein
MPEPLDDSIRRFLDAVQSSAEQLVSFSGDTATTTLVVKVAARRMCSEPQSGRWPASSLTVRNRNAANPVRRTEQHVSGVDALSWRCACRHPSGMKVR